MNNNDPSNNVGSYRAASGNLNTVISNPSVNINDTMNMNIQNMNSNNTNQVNLNTISNNNVSNMVNNNTNNNSNIQNTNSNINNNNNYVATSSNVNRTYVSSENKPKKKTVSIKMGPEFKIAFLIVVILLVFIFLLPMISDLLH